MAKTKPSGTRMRRAIADQLATTHLEQLPGGGYDLCDADFKQTLIGLGNVPVTGGAGGIPQHHAGRAKRAIARRIRGTERSPLPECQAPPPDA